MTDQILLCTDLDRTLLPNGDAVESPQVRQLFSALCAHEAITLVYVSGRDKNLLLEAIERYGIPLPDYAIGDVGSSLYHIQGQQWRLDDAWQAHIAPDWQAYDHQELQQLLQDITGLRLQEAHKQNRFKLSYYLDLQMDSDVILMQMRELLEQHQVHANIIWSVDEPAQVGLIDVLPRSANKLEAIRFLGNTLKIPRQGMLFAGDSGNDLSVLCSDIPAVLVANAEDYVRQEALRLAQKNNSVDALYCAHGLGPQLNGNYAAGIIEGLLHYFPEANNWLETALSSLNSSSTR